LTSDSWEGAIGHRRDVRSKVRGKKPKQPQGKLSDILQKGQVGKVMARRNSSSHAGSSEAPPKKKPATVCFLGGRSWILELSLVTREPDGEGGREKTGIDQYDPKSG